MKKKIPHFKTDKEMEDFLEQDLSDYLHPENFAKVEFEFEPKTEKVNMRMTRSMLKTLKQRAKKAHLPYQRYMRQIIEHALASEPR
jgi:predicted DNA binding CopG/RHH family protein